MITRATVSSSLNHWMYSPLREILKLVSTFRPPTHGDTQQPQAPPAHIIVDPNRVVPNAKSSGKPQPLCFLVYIHLSYRVLLR